MNIIQYLIINIPQYKLLYKLYIIRIYYNTYKEYIDYIYIFHILA